MFTNIGEIVESNSNLRESNEISGDRKPLIFEYDKLKRTLTDFVEIYFSGRLGRNGCRSARSNKYEGGYNIYGRLVTKKKKGIFKLLCCIKCKC